MELAYYIMQIRPEFLGGIVRLDSYNTVPANPNNDANILAYDGTGIVPIVWFRFALPSNIVEVKNVLVNVGDTWVEARRTIGRYEMISSWGVYGRPTSYQPSYIFRADGNGQYFIDIAGVPADEPWRVEVWYVRRPLYLNHETDDVDTDLPDFCFDAICYRAMSYVFQYLRGPADDKAAIFLQLYNSWLNNVISRFAVWNLRSIDALSNQLRAEYNVGLDRDLRRLSPSYSAVRRED